MTPIEETKVYEYLRDNVKVRVRLDKSGLSDLRVGVEFRQYSSIPNDDLDDRTLMENHINSLAEFAFYNILEQCGVTYKDYQLLLFCKEFMGKDGYDCIPAYRGCRMGSCDSRNEESSGVVGEE